MKTKNTTKKMPEFKAEKEMAEFWDTHDFTDYEDEFEKVDDIVFERPTKNVISVRLEHDDVVKLKKISHAKGVGYTTLARMWIMERLKTLSVQ